MKVEAKIHAQWDEYAKEWRYSFFASDMTAYGYTYVQDIAVEFEPPPHSVMIQGMVAAYRAKQAEIRAKAAMEVTALQQKIDDMMCLEFKPEPQA